MPRSTPGLVRGRDVRVHRSARIEVWPGASITLGDGCEIGPRARLVANGGALVVGDGARVGTGCTVIAHERVEIEAGAVLGEEVMVLDFDHDTSDVEVPIRRQGLLKAPVRIGAGARIDLRACVLRGVTVGDGAHVLAHSVVSRDIPAAAVAEGVPARVVRV